MPRFTVHMTQTVSTAIDVDVPEGTSPDEMIDIAYRSNDMPGCMVHGAFGLASVDESGDWEAVAVSDDDGKQVWPAKLRG